MYTYLSSFFARDISSTIRSEWTLEVGKWVVRGPYAAFCGFLLQLALPPVKNDFVQLPPHPLKKLLW